MYSISIYCDNARYLIDTNGELTVSQEEMLATFGEIIKEVKDEMARQGRPDAFIGARVSDKPNTYWL